MTSAFDAAFDTEIGYEGAYSADPLDPGNWTGGKVGSGTLRGTKYGISAASYPTLDIEGLTLNAARAIYRAEFWNHIAGDKLPAPIAAMAFDCAINQGRDAAARILQTAIGVEVDGIIGPMTAAVAMRCAANCGPTIIEMAARRAVRYAATDMMPRYGLGWMRRLFDVTARTLTATTP